MIIMQMLYVCTVRNSIYDQSAPDGVLIANRNVTQCECNDDDFIYLMILIKHLRIVY